MLEAPRPLAVALEFSALFLALATSFLPTFLSASTHPCQHGERDHQANAYALPHRGRAPPWLLTNDRLAG